MRELWHTFRVDCSAAPGLGITGIGIVVQESQRAGRDGRVIAEIAEAYTDITASAGEKFAVLRALEIAAERGYGRVKVRSDFNSMRTALSRDHRARVNQSTTGLHGRILRLAAGFEEVRFAWIPRRKNQQAHRLARQARTQTPMSRPECDSIIPRSGGGA